MRPMLLRMASLFLRTLREDPADAEVTSHRLLVRAGYIRRAGPGGYAYLPLGNLLRERISELVSAELAAIGGQQVQLPSLLAAEPFQTSGRFAEFGDLLFQVPDRRGNPQLLAPADEEPMTLLVKDLLSSYRDYPLVLYQLRAGFRNESRPRGGLLRTREFLVADSYSFDVDSDGMTEAYAAHRAAYQRIAERLGLRYTVVAGSAGPAGGSRSEEFLAETPAGEDPFACCTLCGYAASTDAVTTPAPPPRPLRQAPPAQVHDTPDTPTIESLVALANQRRLAGRADWQAADTLKNVAVEVRGPGAPTAELVVIGLPGDREVDLRRLEAALYPATVSLFEDWESRPELVRGYLGPQQLAELGVRYLVDPRVVPGSSWLTGANQAGQHATNVVCGRDFHPGGTVEAASIRDGDPCPACEHGALEIRRGIEIGQLSQLGRRYSDAFSLDALGPTGKPARVLMGRYALGVSRLMAAVAEQHHDDAGLVWPAAVAPCDVHLVPTSDKQLTAAAALAEELAGAGWRVLLDDRAGVSAGVRFADADLLGMPWIVVLGRRLADGYIELRERATGQRRDVALKAVEATLSDLRTQDRAGEAAD